MALIKCPDCGTDVSDAAPACPKCARPIATRTVSKSGTKPKRASGGIFWFVVVILLLWVYFKTKGPDEETVSLALPVAHLDSTKAPEQPAPVEQAAVVTMTPDQLYQQYSANEVATDQAIAGRVVQVTAPVKSIDKDLFDSAVLHFATANEFTDMGAKLDDSQKPRAATLSQGQIVTVQCKTMRRMVGSPMGSDCAFIDTPAEDASVSAVNQAPEQGAAEATVPASSPSAQQVTQAGDQVGQSNQPAETTSAALTAPASTASTATPTALQKVIANVNGPSFDCSTATSLGARAICGNTQLSQLDRQMAILYYSQTNFATNATVRDKQLAWIRNRNQACVADVVCLTEQYNQRIKELQSSRVTALNSGDQTRVTGAGADALSRYSSAVQQAITQQWKRPKVMPNGSCLVHIVQTPGGNVVSVTVDESCPYDDPTKASVENAVFGAQPLPYSGFESVFQRNIDVTLSP